MKIIMSPSKTQNRKAIAKDGRDILWPEKTKYLFEVLRDYSIEEMGEMMKIKGELLEETFELYENWSPASDRVKAMDLYQGVAFDGIGYKGYKKEQRDYLKSHLVILSAIYGALSPDTLIWPYRLDMTIKLGGENLYGFWRKEMEEMFKDEDLVVNLASNEFSRMVKPGKGKVLNIHFKMGLGKDSKRISSYQGKKARGEMGGLLAENLAYTRENIRNLAPEGFLFDQELSDEDNFYYGFLG